MLIVQDDIFNQSQINTVIVITITSNTKLAEAPGNVLPPRESSGLPRDSVANVSQILTIDKSFLTDRVTTLPDYLQTEVDAGLRTVLYLQSLHIATLTSKLKAPSPQSKTTTRYGTVEAAILLPCQP